MKVRDLHLVPAIALGLLFCVPSRAKEPLIPPTVVKISPAGMMRGSTVTYVIEGRSLSDATDVLFDAPGLSGKVTEITDVPEKIMAPRAGQDLEAQVPLGLKQTAELEIVSTPDTQPGIHRFRVKTPKK